MAVKINDKHLEVLCNFMENHADFARGRLNAPSARETYKHLWGQLALQLNSLGYGERSIDKWQKTWTDFKYNLKRKASAHKLELNQTGGGPNKSPPFTEFDERILQILGKSFYEGINRPETGLQVHNSTTAKLPPQQEFEDVESSLNNEQSIRSNPINNIGDVVPGPSNSSQNAVRVLFPKGIRKRQDNEEILQKNDDHSYVKTPQKKRRKLTDEEMCQESLTILTKIHSNLSTNLPKIANALTKLADYVTADGNE